VVIFLDGDYGDRPAELPLLLAPIAEGRADITIGSRLAGPCTPGSLPRHAVFGNWLAASLITLLYGVKISDLGPFRAARANVFRAVELEEGTYGWAVELILKGAIHGFRVVEVPVSYHPRIGKSKISGTFRGTAGAAWFILSCIARRAAVVEPHSHGRGASGVADGLSLVLHLVDPILMLLPK